MAYTFRLQWRSPHSEAYAVLADGEPVGRLDVHVDTALSAGECNLSVGESLTQGTIGDLVRQVREDILIPGFRPESLSINVFQGNLIIEESYELEYDDDDDDDED